jgi:hypothetical protein
MFTNINTALEVAKSNLGIAATDTARDTEILTILRASQASRTDVTYYRPYLVAAYFLPLWGMLQRQGLIAADDAKWLTPAECLPMIQSLLTFQEAADCGLEIEPCWSVEALRIRLTCGCDADQAGLLVGMLGAMVL